MPGYIFQRATLMIGNAAIQQNATFEPPLFQEEDILEHFIQPADWSVCRRMAEIAPMNNHAKVYPINIEVDGWVSTVGIQARSSGTFFPPDHPTRHDYLPRGRSALIDSCYEMVEYRRDTNHTWGLAMGVLRSLNATLTSTSQLKMLWPDFSLLVAGILQKIEKPSASMKYWAKTFDENAGRPRDMPALIPNLGEYI